MTFAFHPAGNNATVLYPSVAPNGAATHGATGQTGILLQPQQQFQAQAFASGYGDQVTAGGTGVADSSAAGQPFAFPAPGAPGEPLQLVALPSAPQGGAPPHYVMSQGFVPQAPLGPTDQHHQMAGATQLQARDPTHQQQQQQQGSMMPMTFIHLPTAVPAGHYYQHQPHPQQHGQHHQQQPQHQQHGGGHAQRTTINPVPPLATAAAPTPFATAALAHDPADKGPKQLIVNFLAPNIAAEDLTELFAPVGPLAAVRIMRDLKTNESKGFGFVYFHSSDDAAAAIRRVTGRTMEGRRIKVSYANPQRPLD